MKRKGALILLLVLSVIGFLDAAYLTVKHYTEVPSTFCNINSVLSCDTVTQSIYSEVLGVPVALMGGLFFLSGIIYFSYLLKTNEPMRYGDTLGLYVAGLSYGVYLIYVQHFILQSYCIMCLLLDSILLLSVLLLTIHKHCLKTKAIA